MILYLLFLQANFNSEVDLKQHLLFLQTNFNSDVRLKQHVTFGSSQYKPSGILTKSKEEIS